MHVSVYVTVCMCVHVQYETLSRYLLLFLSSPLYLSLSLDYLFLQDHDSVSAILLRHKPNPSLGFATFTAYHPLLPRRMDLLEIEVSTQSHHVKTPRLFLSSLSVASASITPGNWASCLLLSKSEGHSQPLSCSVPLAFNTTSAAGSTSDCPQSVFK